MLEFVKISLPGGPSQFIFALFILYIFMVPVMSYFQKKVETQHIQYTLHTNCFILFYQYKIIIFDEIGKGSIKNIYGFQVYCILNYIDLSE